MKTLLIFSLSLFLFSCSSPKPLIGELADTGTEEETSIRGGEVAANLFSKDKSEKVESRIEYMFYENRELPFQDSVNRIIKSFISGVVSFGGGATEQDGNMSVEFVEESMDKFTDEYKRQLEFVDGDGIWTTEASATIMEDKSEYVEVSLSNWTFTGGAHGNAWSEEILIDKKTGNRLTLNDFITDYSELRTIAEEIFRADQEIPENQSLEAAGFWFDADVFGLNDNFVFNEDSLSFLYNQYEIAPYAAGIIYLNIPLDRIKHLIKRKVD